MFKNNKLKYFFLFCILIGILFRFLNLRFNTQFTWDQENSLAVPATEILLDHHLKLTGAKTGIGDIFLSPYYSYLVAFFFLIYRLDPIAGAVLAGLLSLTTIILGFQIIKKKLSIDVAFLFALLWSISPFILVIDRVPWNVNLFPLSSLLIFFGLYSLMSAKNDISSWILIGLGLFLGLNSHFTVIFYLFLLMMLFIIEKNIRNRLIVISLIFIFVALIPEVVFNFLHKNIILNNSIRFFSTSTSTVSQLIPRVVSIFFIQLEVMGKVIFDNTASWFQITVGFIYISVLLSKYKSNKPFIKLFFLIFFVYLVGFSVFNGSTPDYYFSGLITLSVVGWGIIFSDLIKYDKKIKIILSIFVLALLYQSYLRISYISDQSLGVKQEMVKTIKNNLGVGNNDFNVIYDMDLGWSFGYDYIFKYFELDKRKNNNSSHIYWISYPQSRYPGVPDKIISNVALGFPKSTENILNSKDVDLYSGLLSIRIPKYWIVSSCPYIDFDTYFISSREGGVNCDALSSDMQVVNIPNCDINKYTSMQKKILPGGLELYIVNNINIISKDFVTGKILLTSLEQNRCIGLIDLKNNSLNSLNFDTILNSLRGFKR